MPRGGLEEQTMHHVAERAAHADDAPAAAAAATATAPAALTSATAAATAATAATAAHLAARTSPLDRSRLTPAALCGAEWGCTRCALPGLE